MDYNLNKKVNTGERMHMTQVRFTEGKGTG